MTFAELSIAIIGLVAGIGLMLYVAYQYDENDEDQL